MDFFFLPRLTIFSTDRNIIVILHIVICVHKTKYKPFDITDQLPLLSDKKQDSDELSLASEFCVRK